MAGLIVDRDRFLVLAGALAAAGCAPASTPPVNVAPAPVAQAPEPAPVTTVQAPPAGTSQPDDEALVVVTVDPETEEDPRLSPQGVCDNDVGEVSCDFITPAVFRGPACEGFAGSCGLLKDGYGYKPRVAAAIARCWQDKGAAACNMRVRQRCNREGIASACPDPQFTAHCEQALDQCRQRGQRPDFDLEECVKTLSSLEGGNLEWAKSAIGPSREGCKLMFPVY